MLKQILQTLKDLITSKKFLAALGSSLISICSYLAGLIDGQAMWAGIIGSFGVYKISQGIADHGKEAIQETHLREDTLQQRHIEVVNNQAEMAKRIRDDAERRARG